MLARMARLATTADVFNAIAEPQRRRILSFLREGERPVTDIVQRLHMSQPLASKHLRVLRTVDLVEVRHSAQQRFYRINALALKPIHQWVGGFEQFWNDSFDRLEEYLQDLQDKDRHEHEI
jgi:DNA-binding transcriptional ArsR family regulator